MAKGKKPSSTYGQTVVAKQIVAPTVSKPGETKGQTVVAKVIPPKKSS